MEDSRALAADLLLRLAGANDRHVDGVVVDALAALADRAGAGRAYVTLFHDDGSFENSHEWTADGVVRHQPVIRRLRSADFAYSYEMARRGDVLAVPRLAELPEAAASERTSFSSFGVHAVLQVPIHVSDSFVGLVGINHFEPTDRWPTELIELVHRVGQAIGVVLVRQRAVAAAERAAQDAARAQRQREELVGHVSHELLTPLHAILGYAELLELDSRSATDREALAQIDRHGRHLLTLIEGLLVLSEAERLAEPVDVGAAVDDTVAEIDPVARTRHVRIERGGDPGGPPVFVDGVRCRQVLYCLLTGAIDALGEDGTVEIELERTSTPPSIHVRVIGGAGLDRYDVVTPFTRALIDGYGQIVETLRASGRVDLVVELATEQTADVDQLASP